MAWSSRLDVMIVGDDLCFPCYSDCMLGRRGARHGRRLAYTRRAESGASLVCSYIACVYDYQILSKKKYSLKPMIVYEIGDMPTGVLLFVNTKRELKITTAALR